MGTTIQDGRFSRFHGTTALPQRRARDARRDPQAIVVTEDDGELPVLRLRVRAGVVLMLLSILALQLVYLITSVGCASRTFTM